MGKDSKFIKIISWIILIGLTIFSIQLLLWFYTKIIEFVKIFSTLDAIVIVALFTGSVTILTTFAKIYFDFKQTRIHYLNQKREKSYYHFVEIIYKVNKRGKDEKSYTDEDMMNDIQEFSQELTLWGSRRVVECWSEFRRVSVSSSDGKELLKISEKIMNEMRNDLGVKRAKEKALLSFFINDIENL